MPDNALKKLSQAAGLILAWEDSDGRPMQMPLETQRVLLDILGFPAGTEAEVEDSLQRLERWNNPRTVAELPPLITVDVGKVIDLPCLLTPGTPYTLVYEKEALVSENHASVPGQVDGSGRIPAVDEIGYHRLRIDGTELTLAVAPERCFSVADATDEPVPRLCGLAAQLYSLRRPGDGGFGDALALEHLGLAAAREGVGAIAVSPTHAMFSTNPGHYSPYSPSSRLLENALYCSPEGLFGEAMVGRAISRCGVEDELRKLEAEEFVDWSRAGALKLIWLRALYEDFMDCDENPVNALKQQLADFRSFLIAGGEALEDHCRFEALLADQGLGNWRDWPPELRDPRNDAVARFAENAAHEVGFHGFLQWLVYEALSRAQAAFREAGMPIGIIADLAVGADGAGSQTWSRQGEILEGASLGAPPDTFNVFGQDWGLTAFSPQGLIQSGYRSFIDMLRASLSHAGGVRIDHILGLLRLWLVPKGASPDQGGYVSLPLDDLLRLIALESRRHCAIVIGEDLGTVAPGFSEKLAARGILGMQVLWFEREADQAFKPPEQWSPEAMATTSTHDLATVAGWWAGRDIDWRARLNLYREDQSVEAEREARAEDRARLARALGLARAANSPEKLEANDIEASRVLDGCVNFLGRVPAPLSVLPLEDLLGLEEQPNLPATIDEHPNWRRRWAPDAKDLLEIDGVRHRLEQFRQGREESASVAREPRRIGKPGS